MRESSPARRAIRVRRARIVAAAKSKAVFERALAKAGVNGELVILPGLGHGLGGEESRELHPTVLKLVTQWILSVPGRSVEE